VKSAPEGYFYARGGNRRVPRPGARGGNGPFQARGLRHFESAFRHKAVQFSVLEFEYLFGTFFLNTRDDFF